MPREIVTFTRNETHRSNQVSLVGDRAECYTREYHVSERVGVTRSIAMEARLSAHEPDGRGGLEG